MKPKPAAAHTAHHTDSPPSFSLVCATGLALFSSCTMFASRSQAALAHLLRSFKIRPFSTATGRSMPYYAVANGRAKGVVKSWSECHSLVSGYSGAKYKKFNTASEARAFVNSGSGTGGSTSGGSSKPLRTSAGGYAKPLAASKITKPLSSRPQSSNHENIYVDGASRGNGRDSNPKSGYGVYYGENDSRNAAVPLSLVNNGKAGTNQRAELHAMNHALENISKEVSLGAKPGKQYTVHSDSQYTIKAVTQWSNNWKSNGWKTSTGCAVQNRDLIEKAVNTLDNIRLQAGDSAVDIKYVPGHAGHHGNEMADKLANEGADND